MGGKKINSVADLGEIVRSWRKENRLSQQELADFSGVGRIFVVHLEQGKPTIQMGKALDVLESLGLELVVKRREG
jgi:y4mF family transcriptional regulator